jgi:hypothetical protein
MEKCFLFILHSSLLDVMPVAVGSLWQDIKG